MSRDNIGRPTDKLRYAKTRAKLPETLRRHQVAWFSWWHCLESVWLVKTTLANTQMLDTLPFYMDANDKILVAVLVGTCYTLDLAQACDKWSLESFAW